MIKKTPKPKKITMCPSPHLKKEKKKIGLVLFILGHLNECLQNINVACVVEHRL